MAGSEDGIPKRSLPIPMAAPTRPHPEPDAPYLFLETGGDLLSHHRAAEWRLSGRRLRVTPCCRAAFIDRETLGRSRAQRARLDGVGLRDQASTGPQMPRSLGRWPQTSLSQQRSDLRHRQVPPARVSLQGSEVEVLVEGCRRLVLGIDHHGHGGHPCRASPAAVQGIHQQQRPPALPVQADINRQTPDQGDGPLGVARQAFGQLRCDVADIDNASRQGVVAQQARRRRGQQDERGGDILLRVVPRRPF